MKFMWNNDFRDNSIELIYEEIKTIKDAYDYMLNKKGYRSLLIEAGPSITNSLYEDFDKNAQGVELLVLSVYDGAVLISINYNMLL